MSRIINHGSKRHQLRSWSALVEVSLKVMWRRLTGRPLVKGWAFDFEIGVLFWRGQFIHALAKKNIHEARAYFDSLQTLTDETYEVLRRDTETGDPKGQWIIPQHPKSDVTVLYFHGGGYTFNSAISDRFADMLAALLGIRVFALDYRLTPEHPHPAQQQDAIGAYQYMLAQGVDPDKLVIIGDSAGGHLALMTLLSLHENGLPQPALAIGLCPWTDIGERGESLFGNDPYDVVSGALTIQFGKFLVGETAGVREALSPMYQDYGGLAPLYLQAGGREVLVDMIRDFAQVQADQAGEVMLDVWPDMPHDFQAHGNTHPDSTQAIARISDAIAFYTAQDSAGFDPIDKTEVNAR